jgi:hypothetical protein
MSSSMNILEQAENEDLYRTSCANSFLNNKAREGQGYELSTLSADAERSLRNAIDLIPLYKICQIAIINGKADNGFPHTRPKNLVCIPDSLCSNTPATPKFMETLLHEAIHVHQRLNKNLWKEGLKKVGWTPVSPDEIPDEFKERLRLNPDTILEPFWAWSTHHVPLCMFRNVNMPSLGNTVVEWLDLRTHSLFHNPPDGFKKAYPMHINQMEHPYEIYAEILADLGIKTISGLETAILKL